MAAKSPLCPSIADGIAVAEAVDGLHHAADALTLHAGKVLAHGLNGRTPCEDAFALDALLQRSEGIRHGGQAAPIHADVVIFHAAIGGVQPLFDGAMTEQV